MEILIVAIVFIIAFSYIIGFINRTVKEGEICQCESHPGGCHKQKNTASGRGCH